MTRIKRMYPYYGYGPGSYGYPYSSPWSSSSYAMCEATIDSYRRKVVALESELSEFRAKKCEDDIKAKVAASPEMARVEDVTAEDGPHAALAEARKILVEAWKAREDANRAKVDATDKMAKARELEQASNDRRHEASRSFDKWNEATRATEDRRKQYEGWMRSAKWLVAFLVIVSAAQVAMIDWERIINWF